MPRGSSCLRAGFCCGGGSAVADAIYRCGYRCPVARRSIPPARPSAVSAALPAAHRCAAWRGDGPARGRFATPAGCRRCGGGGATPFPAPCPPRYGYVAARAPMRVRGHGAGRRARYRCVAERATALKAMALHARAWNPKLPCDRCEMRSAHSRCRVSNNLITTVLVARQDSGGRITRARRTYIHIRTQSRARARAVKTQPQCFVTSTSRAGNFVSFF